MDDRQQLISWLSLFSLQKGEEFTLASGAKSDIYVNVKKTALHGRVHKLLAKLLFDKMVEQFAPFQAVAGVALGGCHLASIVAMHSPIDLDVIHVRKAAKEHGTKELLERPSMTQYEEVVLVEDVVTTGGSSIAAAKAIEDAGFEVKGILAVVDRRANKKPYLSAGLVDWKFASLVNFEELEY